jgi:hypothetical protein
VEAELQTLLISRFIKKTSLHVTLDATFFAKFAWIAGLAAGLWEARRGGPAAVQPPFKKGAPGPIKPMDIAF